MEIPLDNRVRSNLRHCHQNRCAEKRVARRAHDCCLMESKFLNSLHNTTKLRAVLMCIKLMSLILLGKSGEIPPQWANAHIYLPTMGKVRTKDPSHQALMLGCLNTDQPTLSARVLRSTMVKLIQGQALAYAFSPQLFSRLLLLNQTS